MTQLDILVNKAVEAFKALPPKQQREMLEEQRQSWARGEAGLDRDGQTTVVASKPADNIQARLTAMSKTILRLRDVLLLIADNIDDEGDRYYFGSTNDADQLKDIAEELDGWHWDQIISDSKLPNIYETSRKAIVRAERAEADIASTFDTCLVLNSRIEDLAEKLAAAKADGELMDALKQNSWDLRCFDIPTGGDDADIGWRVIGHWQAKPHERTVAEVYNDDPRAAIRAAIEVKS